MIKLINRLVTIQKTHETANNKNASERNMLKWDMIKQPKIQFCEVYFHRFAVKPTILLFL